MNKDQRLFFSVIGGGLLLTAGWYTLHFSALRGQLSSGYARSAELVTVIDRAQLAQRGLPGLEVQLVERTAQNEAFLGALPQRTNYAPLSGSITDVVTRNGANFESLSYARMAPNNLPAGIYPLQVNLKMSGTFPQLFRVLTEIEGMDRFVRVSGMTLDLSKTTVNNRNVDAGLALMTYVYDPGRAPKDAPVAAPEAADGGKP